MIYFKHADGGLFVVIFFQVFLKSMKFQKSEIF